MTRVLSDMAAQGSRFQPAQLLALGLPGLSAVLDHLLPDTADPGDVGTTRSSVARLVRQLGDDDFRVREAASASLMQLGPIVRAFLLEASGNADAEISWRATRILRKWDARQERDERKLVDAFAVYLQQVRDAPCLEELARRTGTALGGAPPHGARHQLLSHCLMALGRSGKDEYSKGLEPLLEHENVHVAVLVVEMMGSGSQLGYFPPLLLDALRSDREKVVAAAIRYTPNCRDETRRAEVKRLLIAIFQGDDEPLKFQACVPLTQSFSYPQAADYLIAQLHSKDPQCRDRTIACIGNPSNRGRPASEQLIASIRPLLQSDDQQTRREAMRALAIYCGENVVSTLIPLLDDPKAIIATELGYRLRQQSDKEMLRRSLAHAAKNNPSEIIRKKAALILEQLDKQ